MDEDLSEKAAPIYEYFGPSRVQLQSNDQPSLFSNEQTMQTIRQATTVRKNAAPAFGFTSEGVSFIVNQKFLENKVDPSMIFRIKADERNRTGYFWQQVGVIPPVFLKNPSQEVTVFKSEITPLGPGGLFSFYSEVAVDRNMEVGGVNGYVNQVWPSTLLGQWLLKTKHGAQVQMVRNISKVTEGAESIFRRACTNIVFFYFTNLSSSANIQGAPTDLDENMNIAAVYSVGNIDPSKPLFSFYVYRDPASSDLIIEPIDPDYVTQAAITSTTFKDMVFSYNYKR